MSYTRWVQFSIIVIKPESTAVFFEPRPSMCKDGVSTIDFDMYWPSISNIPQCSSLYYVMGLLSRVSWCGSPWQRKWLTLRSSTNASIYRVMKHATVRLLRSRLNTSLAFRRCIAGWNRREIANYERKKIRSEGRKSKWRWDPGSEFRIDRPRPTQERLAILEA